MAISMRPVSWKCALTELRHGTAACRGYPPARRCYPSHMILSGMDAPREIACALDAGEQSDRRRAWEATGRSLLARERIDGGFRLVYGADQDLPERLTTLFNLERECCPWATWTLRRDENRCVVEVTSESEAIQGLAAAFAV